MTLLDLTKELFTYLVRFREQAAEANPPAPEQVAEDLDAIFSRMEDQARANPALGAGYEQVRYALAALCDEVALCGDWPGKGQWSQHTWEERLYGTREGGQRFFIFMDRLDSLPKDVLAVHYLCLTLGFCGCYAPGDPRLGRIKAQVLGRLPGVAPAPGPPAAPAAPQ
ncbi:MAG: DotU family type IV/VI secretion system protein, partial [Pseudomonadota bacterium]